jgi:Fe-S cluster assembly iron-binding protein IscA
MVKLEPGAGQAIRTFLSENGIQGPVRIELRFAGCCDPSLGLRVDEVRESDLVREEDGVTFVMSPETFQIAGDVTIACADDGIRKGFVLTSGNPVSEWDGFVTCSIKT